MTSPMVGKSARPADEIIREDMKRDEENRKKGDSDFISTIKEDFKRDLAKIDEEIYRDTQEVINDIPKYDWDDTKDFKGLWDYVVYYKWLINLVVVAFPWLLTAIASMVVFFYFQIKLNDGFADGNLILLGLSIYYIYQSIMSILVVFEEPTFLLYHKAERSIAFDSGIIFNVIWIIGAVKLYYALYKEDHQDYDTDDWGPIMILFFLAYVEVMTFPIALTNFVLIIKEVLLEYFQLLTKTVGGELQNYSLGKADTVAGMQNIFWFLDPFTWIDLFWQSIFGYPVEDYWEENPNDEGHYYKNWGKQ